MPTFDNPYFHWSPIRDQVFFHDREEETRQVLWSIGHGQCVSLVGPRKIGKTSLLLHLQSLDYGESSAQKGRVVCVYIDGQAHRATQLSELYSEILGGVCEVLAQEGGEILPTERPQEKTYLSHLRRAVRSFIRRGIQPVLLIDEFDVLCENHNFDLSFFNGLRSLATLGVVYVTASKHTLFQLDRDKEILGSPFFNYFRSMYIGLFSEASSVELIREPAARCGIRFDEQTVQEISRLAGGHPFFLQRVCYIAFEMCRTKKGALGQEDYERMRAKSQQELEEQMARYWEDLGPEERQILFVVATGEALQQDSAVTPDNLIQKSLLVKLNGSYQVFSSLFKDYVCAQPYSEPLRPRKWLDRFEIKEPLGLSRRSTEPAGRSMRSLVYKAYQPLLDRDVVIKELTLRADVADEYAEHFRLEARLIARLDHPNILPVYDFYQEEGRAYLVMKYASNGSLADRLAETKGAFDPTQAIETVCYVGRALGYAHRQGVIHRDVKPSNIFIGVNDWPMLGDFGLALGEGKALTEQGGLVGSADYIAPEQATDAGNVDERSDIYSLGVVLYHLLVGEVPYGEEASAEDRLVRRLRQGILAPRLRNPRVPEGMERIILKATASDPGSRYQTAVDMVEDLMTNVPIPAHALAETVEGLLAVMGFAVQDREVVADGVRIVCASEGALARSSVVVCKEGAVERSDVEALIDEVKKRHWSGGVLITYTRISPAARRQAAATEDRVRVFTLSEFYRELIDFEPYVRALVASYEAEEVYTYYVDLACESADGSIYKPIDDYLDAWLDDPARNRVSILGDNGAGKTTFCRQYAAELGRRWLAEPDQNRIPILISPRDYAEAMSLQQLLTDFLVDTCGVQASYEAFGRFNADGRLLLLLDGLDEMMQKVNHQTTSDSFGQLAQVMEPRSKVVLTCRTSYFYTHREAEELLSGRLEAPTECDDSPSRASIDMSESSHFEIIRILPFDREDVKSVLRARYPVDAARYLQQIQDMNSLMELAQRPAFLDMIVSSLSQLGRGQAINIARLYEAYTNMLFDREERKGQTFLTRDGKRLLMQELALEMLRREESSIPRAQLQAWVLERFHQEDADKIGNFEHEIQTCPFLSRDSEGNYRFIHKSFQEFFVAQWLAPRVLDGSAQDIEINDEIKGFVRGLLGDAEKPEQAKGLELTASDAPATSLSSLEALAQACAANRCVLYVGAGLSAQAGFPTWETFVRGLLDWVVGQGFVGEDLGESLHAALAQDQPDLVIDSVVSAVPARAQPMLHEYLREIFLAPSPELPRSYRLLEGIRFSAILTTNFDQLLDRTFGHQSPQVYTPEDAELLLDALARQEFFILKLCGVLERPDTVLLGPAQYEDAIANNRPLLQFMESLFFSRTMLFLGTSLEGIESYLEGFSLQRYKPRQHYALVAAAGAAWQAKADRLSRRYGIQIIPYVPDDAHSELIEFLEELARKAGSASEGTKEGRSRESAWLERVYLENIGPFDQLELELDRHWNILLGDNGVGKSTVLKAIAVAISGKDAEPYAARLIKAGRTSAQITLETAGRRYATKLLRTSRGAEIDSTPGRPLEAEGWLALGFPPLRSLSWEASKGPQLEEGGRRPVSDDLLPLVRGGPDSRLDDLKQWIVNLDYRSKAAKESKSEDRRFERVLQEYFQIMDCLTEGMTLRFRGVDPESRRVKVITDDGEVPLEAVSQGTASLTGWIGSLLQRMYEIYGYEDNPMERYALVLIDEIDAHMHPWWQQSTVPALAELFPNVQFIATTHSPLVVAGMPTEQVFRLARDEFENVIELDIEPDMTMGRTDQILTGTLFDLETSLDRTTQKEIEKYQRLLGKRSRTEQEEEEFHRLQRVLAFRIPVPQETPPERRAQELLQALLLMQVGDKYPEAQRIVLKKAEQLFDELQARQAKKQ